MAEGGGSRVLAIHCSEPGVQEEFRRFLDAKSPGAVSERIALPGGAWWLARVEGAARSRLRRWLSGDFEDLRARIAGHARRRGLATTLLVGHQGCSWYEREGRSASEAVRSQGEDILAGCRLVQEWLEPEAVEGYILILDAKGALAPRQIL